LQISFAKRRLQNTCEKHRSLRKEHGAACAKKISARLADLEAASSLEHFRHLPGGCHELDGDRSGQLALKLPDGKRLIIRPSANPAPTKTDGGLDWSAVETVEVIEIINYHE
jgi:proteic killer suppression protein